MRKFILFAATFTLAGAAFAQESTGSLSQSTQSESTSSNTTTSSGFDSSSTSGPPENQGSAEMTEWIKSNSTSESSRSSSISALVSAGITTRMTTTSLHGRSLMPLGPSLSRSMEPIVFPREAGRSFARFA